MNDPRATILNEENGHKTVLFSENKGPYCVTTNSNTLSKDLEHGFEQANTIILKLENMDSGSFKDAVEYLLRNEISYGNLILINNYGRVFEISKKGLKTGLYKKKIKGFL